MLNFQILLITLLLLVIAAPVDAKKKSRKKSRKKNKVELVQAASLRLELIDTALLAVPFGRQVDEVMSWIEKRVGQAYEPRFAGALDARERDTLKHRMRLEISEIRNKIVTFDGQTTGFEASVVQGEFAVKARESLLLFRDGGTDHYLFFSEGVLWKYARPLSTAEGFKERAAGWIRDQGQPAKREGTDVLVWRGLDYTLRLENRRLVSASDLLIMEWNKARSDVDARREAARAAQGEATKESELDSYFE